MKSLKRMIILTVITACITVYPQEQLLCMGYYWTEDEANLKMKEFAKQWDDIDSWQKRAEVIKQGIIKGMHLDQMSSISGNFSPIIRNGKTLDGYSVENIAIESFPGFYITGNLYRPTAANEKHAAYNFFAHHLDLNGGNIPYEDGYQEDFVKILPKDELSVFTEKDSRPENAFHTIEDIIEYLEIEL